MVEQQKSAASEPEFKKLPVPSTFVCWKTNFQKELCSGSGHPAEAMPWIKEVESWRIQSRIFRHHCRFWTSIPEHRDFDARIATALKKIIQNSTRRSTLESRRHQKEDRFLHGRQIAFMICEYFRVTGTHETILDPSDLSRLT